MKQAKYIGVLIGSGIALSAHAQSSVTLYGLVDVGATYISNVEGQKFVGMTSGNIYESRFGLKGQEDLGGGLAATFLLENGFSTNNGEIDHAGAIFGRQATVGLSSTKYGSVNFGRQTDAMSDLLGKYSNCWDTGGYGYHFGDNDNLCQLSAFFNNAVKYASPEFAGVQFSAMYGFGNQPGAMGKDASWALAANYQTGPVSAGVGYLHVNSPGSSGGPFDSAGVGTLFSNPDADHYVGSMSGNYIGIQDADAWKVLAAGASLVLGKATVSAVYSNSKYVGSEYLADASGGAAPKTDVTFNNYELSAIYNLTETLSLNGSYGYTQATLSAVDRTGKFHTFSFGSQYSLSKRTMLYLVGAYQLARGDGIYLSGSGFSNAAGIFGVSGSGNQLQLSAGIKHEF